MKDLWREPQRGLPRPLLQGLDTSDKKREASASETVPIQTWQSKLKPQSACPVHRRPWAGSLPTSQRTENWLLKLGFWPLFAIHGTCMPQCTHACICVHMHTRMHMCAHAHTENNKLNYTQFEKPQLLYDQYSHVANTILHSLSDLGMTSGLLSKDFPSTFRKEGRKQKIPLLFLKEGC